MTTTPNSPEGDDLLAGTTPGPWAVAYDDQHGQAVVKGEHTEIATCWHHSVGSIEKQMRANARLIARAPDLAKENARLRQREAELSAMVERLREVLRAVREAIADQDDCEAEAIIRTALKETEPQP